MATNLNSVITYFGNSADDILSQIAEDNLAKQVSSSWLYAVDSTTLQVFQQLAAQGTVGLPMPPAIMTHTPARRMPRE